MESLNRNKKQKIIHRKEGLKRHFHNYLSPILYLPLFSLERKKTPVHHFISDDLVTLVSFFLHFLQILSYPLHPYQTSIFYPNDFHTFRFNFTLKWK